MKAKYLFGDIVVIDGFAIGVVCKTWLSPKGITYEVYNRIENRICEYPEDKIERYRVRHKYLSEEEMEWQGNNG